MSNTLAPFGLRPVRRLDGAAPNYQTNNYLISTSQTHKIGTGDLVKSDATYAGYVDYAAATDTPVLGVFAGCEWYDTSVAKKIFSTQWTGTTTAIAPITCYVYDDVNIVYEIQSSNGGPVTQSQIRQNAKIGTVGPGAPNTTNGISTEYLDFATVATAQATYPLKVIGLSQKVGNDNTSVYNLVEVVLNATNFKSGVA